MIKLPDFSRCVEVQQLLFSMGISHVRDLPVVKFTRKIEKKVIVTVKNTEQLRYAHELKIGSIPLGKGEVLRSHKGLIEINGLKSCVYIKDQRGQYYNNGLSSYRFHLCWCNTIEEMANSGRKNRYVATARDDGLFPVNHQFDEGHEEKLVKLELCKNCRRILEERKMYFFPFTLCEFYKRYQTHIADSFTREETHISEEQYAPNHAEVASKYKSIANYVCSICGVDCSQNKELLHLHHKDGNGQNNKHYNLMVLCIDCHAQQPRHSYMKKNPDFKENMQKVNELRKSQGLIVINNG